MYLGTSWTWSNAEARFEIESVAIQEDCMTDVNNILGRVECELLKTQIFFADLRNENIWGVLDVLNRTVFLKLSCCYICSFIKFRWDSFCSKKVIYSWSEGFGQAIKCIAMHWRRITSDLLSKPTLWAKLHLIKTCRMLNHHWWHQIKWAVVTPRFNQNWMQLTEL